MTIRGHMFSLSFFVSLFFVVFVVLVLGIYELRAVRAQGELYFTNTVQSTNSQLDSLINELDVIACQVIADSDLQEILVRANSWETSGRNYFDYHVSDRVRATEILWTYYAPKRIARQVHVFTDSAYVGTSYAVNRSTVQKQASNDRWNVAPRVKKVIPPHSDDWLNSQYSPNLVFSVVRCLLRTSQPFDLLAHIEVQQDYARIADICDAINAQGYVLLIFDSEGAPVYPISKPSGIDYLALREKMLRGEISYFNYEGERFIGTFNTSSQTGWTVLLMQERSYFNEEMWKMLAAILAAGILALGVLSIVFYHIARNISLPLEEFSRQIEEYPEKNNAPFSGNSNDYHEIDVLEKSFDSMIRRIDESNQRLIAAEESELRLKINELQAKINPHFLHNSLALIAAAGADSRCDLVEEMCCQLSDIFRYVSADEPRQVPLTEELRHAQIYLNFMKWRFEDNFSYECTTHGDTDSHTVNRLIFQPLLENSFRHGYKGIEPPFRMRTICIANESGWSFSVEDNGEGFSAEAREKLFTTFHHIDEILDEGRNYQRLQPSNMAIVNIYLRLKLLYHENARIEISNDSALGGAHINITVRDISGEEE